jgi:hypothetical protein
MPEKRPMKYFLVLAAVLAGDPATVDPRVEVLTQIFDNLSECEAAKAKSTGEGKGEIAGTKVLRIIGQCQEIDAEDVRKLSDALNR